MVATADTARVHKGTARVLTDAACRKFVPAAQRRFIQDLGARSLYFVVETTGRKAWWMRFRRPNGTPGKLVLGPFDLSGRELEGAPQIGQPLTLAAARLLAAEVHRRRALGEDVVADHKAAKHRQRTEITERASNTFAAALRDFIDGYAIPETRNGRDTARYLGLACPHTGEDGEPQEIKGGLCQRWGDRDVRSIDDHDIWTVIDEAKRIGVPGIKARNRGTSEARARALFVCLSSLFNWLRRERRVTSNPCRDVSRPAAARARDRVLSSDEVRWFWQACESADAPRVPAAPRPFAPLLRLLLVTGQREDEVAGMTRDELSDDSATWSLPGERTKNGRPHHVPLPPFARELIASVKAKPNKAGLIFTTTGVSPVSGWSRMKQRLDASMAVIAREERGADIKIPPWRLHDLRRTAITGMNELGVAPHVVELVVNHVSGHRAGVAGVYNKSELMPERKAALERWAAHVLALVGGRKTADVLTMSGRANAS